MYKTPQVVIEALKAKREELVQQRALACKPFDEQIEELDFFLNGATVNIARPFALPAPAASTLPPDAASQDKTAKQGVDIRAARKANKAALDACAEFLAMRSPQKTSELHSMLDVLGLALPVEHPERRLGQLLSDSDRFKSDRKEGWSLAEPASTQVEQDIFGEPPEKQGEQNS